MKGYILKHTVTEDKFLLYSYLVHKASKELLDDHIQNPQVEKVSPTNQ